eukprot:GHVU01121244.1.p1 GENE.GHVU01121244.1~~GHVU01121244.1.p1  ORF type:complete len:117 (+),score=0.42 GHVU01121244.1:665-1015(+)
MRSGSGNCRNQTDAREYINEGCGTTNRAGARKRSLKRSLIHSRIHLLIHTLIIRSLIQAGSHSAILIRIYSLLLLLSKAATLWTVEDQFVILVHHHFNRAADMNETSYAASIHSFI